MIYVVVGVLLVLVFFVVAAALTSELIGQVARICDHLEVLTNLYRDEVQRRKYDAGSR